MIAGWSPARIRQAETTCAAGGYAIAADLCEAMMADERVSKCLDRLYSATTLPLTFQMPGKTAEQSKNDPTCQALEADWWKILPEEQARTMVAWLSLLRVALAHIDGWRKDPETGRVLPIISVWSPRNLRNDPTRGWLVRSSTGSDQFGFEEPVNPGDGNWVIIVAGANYRAAFQAPWRGISRWWLLKLYAQVDWASSSERHGQGQVFVSNTLTASATAGLEGDVGEELDQVRKTELATDIQECGRNGVTVLPRGWKAELVTDGAKTYETFQAQTTAANSAIDMALIGTNLTSEVGENGSRAAGQVHESVDASKFRGMLEGISTGMRQQVIVFWVAYSPLGASIAPYPHWDTTPPRDAKAESEARKADADALNAYVTAGAQIDQIAWFERAGTKLVEGAKAEIKKPIAPSPIATPADGTNNPPKAPPTKKAQALALAAASAGDAAQTALERGHLYLDRLEDECAAHAAKELAPMVAAVVSAIAEATDYEDAKARIIAAYGDEMPPSKLMKLTEAALIMAQLAGRETVEQELQTDE
jgi:hypothetical protein